MMCRSRLPMTGSRPGRGQINGPSAHVLLCSGKTELLRRRRSAIVPFFVGCEQFRQLGNDGRNPSRLVGAEMVAGERAKPVIIGREIGIGQGHAVGIADDVSAVCLRDGPWAGEAALVCHKHKPAFELAFMPTRRGHKLKKLTHVMHPFVSFVGANGGEYSREISTECASAQNLG